MVVSSVCVSIWAALLVFLFLSGGRLILHLSPLLLAIFSPVSLPLSVGMEKARLSLRWISTWQRVGCFWTFSDWSLFSLPSCSWDTSGSDIWGELQRGKRVMLETEKRERSREREWERRLRESGDAVNETKASALTSKLVLWHKSVRLDLLDAADSYCLHCLLLIFSEIIQHLIRRRHQRKW